MLEVVKCLVNRIGFIVFGALLLKDFSTRALLYSAGALDVLISG